MIIKEWLKDQTLDIWIRSTVSYHGPVIYFGGTRSGHPFFSPRRYSVIDATDGIKLKIISLSYMTTFKTGNDYAIHDKYNSGEVVALLTQDFDGTIEEALAWTGITQELGSL